MSNPLSKRSLRETLGFKTDAELARFFEITGAAVAQWPEDRPVPPLRLLQAQLKKPEAFTESSEPLAKAG
jgi:hypothetical protein